MIDSYPFFVEQYKPRMGYIFVPDPESRAQIFALESYEELWTNAVF